MRNASWMKDVQMGFKRSSKEGVQWMFAPALSEHGVKHGFTLRHGGVSDSPFDTLNLGWNRPEPKENIRQNYMRLADAVGFPYESMALVHYEHGDNIKIVTQADAGKGFGMGEFPPCDGLITNQLGITLVTLHADCLPVFLFDTYQRVIGITHAGWQGVSKRIAAKAVQKMTKQYGSKPRDILAAVGPCICPNCFEVDAPVKDVFSREFPEADCWSYSEKTQKFYIDLPFVLLSQLQELGVEPINMTCSDACTYEHPEDYFSYRYARKTTGAMAGFIRLET